MKVLKFGGTSLATTDNLAQVKNIINQETDTKVVVVSAMGKTTDLLKEAALLAAQNNEEYQKVLLRLRKNHRKLIIDLFDATAQNQLLQEVKKLFLNLESLLQGVFLIKELSPKTQDYILSYGERISACILSYYIENASLLDARKVLVAEGCFGNARVNKKLSYPKIKKAVENSKGILITGGFIAYTQDAQTITLGRGGSDYTASIFAAALDVSELQIWTDVDGFMSADPSKVAKAYTIEYISYLEAMELSYFGAKILYTPAVQPVFEKEIPILIKNTFNPQGKGTLVSSRVKNKGNIIKGASSVAGITLINVSSSGFFGTTGVSNSILNALAEKGVNVILIAQASSEFSLSFVILEEDKAVAVRAIEEKFANHTAAIKIQAKDEVAIVAIVGESMINTPGIAGRLFDALGRNGINIATIAQGASERNISCVIAQNDLEKALNVIHDSFFLSEVIEENIFLTGVGTVGNELIKQIKQQQEQLETEHHLRINIVGISNSKKYVTDENGIDLTNYEQLLEKGKNLVLDELPRIFDKMNLANSVFVDCTGAEEVAKLYQSFFEANISIVTANKVACSSDYENYFQLKNLAKKKGVKFLYETNVGAGLPIIGTMKDLVRSGDKILKLEAVLSGTLNYIFNTVSADISLSRAIELAKENGFSEPDPRLDLSGIDVIRKLLILSRESGYQVEKEEVKVRAFLPDSCQDTASYEAFLKLVKQYDDKFEEKRKKLEQEQKKWRYVARMTEGTMEVGLEEVALSHPFYDLQGSNNIVLITTKRYNREPMIIKGYGAGADVTAAGIFADIIKIVNI